MNAVQLIQAERTRQLTLGYGAAHDAKHVRSELSRASLTRLLLADHNAERIGLCDVDLLVRFISPWPSETLHKQSRVRLLTEAAALIAAELERILPEPDAGTAPDDRTYTAMAEAIGVFARATGSVGRITDIAKRRKALELLGDYARHLTHQISAELGQTYPVSAGQPAEGQEEE